VALGVEGAVVGVSGMTGAGIGVSLGISVITRDCVGCDGEGVSGFVGADGAVVEVVSGAGEAVAAGVVTVGFGDGDAVVGDRVGEGDDGNVGDGLTSGFGVAM